MKNSQNTNDPMADPTLVDPTILDPTTLLPPQNPYTNGTGGGNPTFNPEHDKNINSISNDVSDQSLFGRIRNNFGKPVDPMTGEDQSQLTT